LVKSDFIFDKENKQKIHESYVQKAQRYPRSLRHYENYANYSYVHKDASIEDYMKEMNRQVEFPEFMVIMTEHIKEELTSPEGQMMYMKYIEAKVGEMDSDAEEDPDNDFMDITTRKIFRRGDIDAKQAVVMDQILRFDEFVKSDTFINQAREFYAQRVQGYLLEKKVYSLVECLEETVDFEQLGMDLREMPVANTYIPVTNTIMKKPDLRADGGDPEFGLLYNDYENNRSLTR